LRIRQTRATNRATAPAEIAAPILSSLEALLAPCYAEVVTTLAFASLDVKLKRELDSFLATTERALELAGAPRAKAIAVVTPADPPPAMQILLSAVATRRAGLDEARAAVTAALEGVQRCWPDCHPRKELTVSERDTPWGRRPVYSLQLEAPQRG
jgi:acetaldehyde dehydrogenase